MATSLNTSLAPIIGVAVRHALTALASSLGLAAYVTGGTLEAITAGVVALVSVGWAVWREKDKKAA